MRALTALAALAVLVISCTTEPSRPSNAPAPSTALPAPAVVLAKLPIVAKFGEQGIRVSPNGEMVLVIEREGFGKQRSRRREAALLWRALAHFPVSKDILVYSQKEAAAWKDSPGHFLAQALREGRVLYERG